MRQSPLGKDTNCLQLSWTPGLVQVPLFLQSWTRSLLPWMFSF